MTYQGETMAKKKPQLKIKKSLKGEIDYQSKDPLKTERSKGYFYIRHYKKTGNWTLYFESWLDGEKKQEVIPESEYRQWGFDIDMTYPQAHKTCKEYNRTRKGEIKVSRSQLNARRRLTEILEIDSILFPPQITKDFLAKLALSDAKDKHKEKMKNLFNLVQKITKTLKVQPYKYRDRADEVTAIFKEKKFSVSYAKDIIYMMNKWGQYYSKHTGKFYEPVGKIIPNTQRAISRENKLKGKSVRRPSLPLTEEILEHVHQKIDKTNMEEVKFFRWLQCSFYFGLRPSELDQALGNPTIIYDHFSGVPILVIEQTKLIIEDAERIKRIPIVTPQQQKCLNLIESGDKKVLRPEPKWVDKMCRDKNKKYEALDVYDLYAGRKGFVDWLIKPVDEGGAGQTIESASIYAGHKSLSTTWKYYKDRKSVIFQPTPFTQKMTPKKRPSSF